MKATSTTIDSKSNDISTASVSKAGDNMMTSSSQKEGILKKYSILPNKDPPEGKTTTIIAVMRGKPRHSNHRQCSNKHYTSQEANLNLTKINVATVLLLLILLQYINITELFFSRSIKFVCVKNFVFLSIL
jgi:hypothetical protein